MERSAQCSTVSWHLLDEFEPSHLRIPTEDMKTTHWQRYGYDEALPDVFAYHQVAISNDGGLGDIHKLLTRGKYVKVFAKVCLVCVNCYTIASADIRAALGDVPPDTLRATSGFLLTEWLAVDVFCWTQSREHFSRLIQVFELGYMVFNVLAMLLCAFLAFLPRLMKRLNGRPLGLNRWTCVQELFWTYFDELDSYSALKLLHYVTPTVLSSQAYNVVLHWSEHHTQSEHLAGLWHIFLFVFSRTLCFIIGFDSFMIKLRITSQYATGKDTTPYCFLMVLLFLFQVLGVIKINRFVLERLFLFIFGGEDGRLDHDENMLLEVWKALVTRRIFQTYGIFRGCIVMLAFNDKDFQRLALDDNEIEIRMKEGTTITQAI